MTIVSLDQATATCGAKAERLGFLRRRGFAVPDGLVVDTIHEGWEAELSDRLPSLGPGPYAVRSSAVGEDGTIASYAGQLHTTLEVLQDAVHTAVRRTASSGEAAAPRAYAQRTGLPMLGAVLALVQPMVRADATGVLFTRDPVTGTDHVLIEAGLGDDVVAGTVRPERWEVTDARATLVHEGRSRFLSAGQAAKLATLGRQVETAFGQSQDVEWALDGDEVWILQARPITTIPVVGSPSAPTGAVLLEGIAASPGVITGRPCVVRDLDDFSHFGPGDVLVCEATSPAWTPLLAQASAVVTETGGILAHAAIVAREFGIPAIVGTRQACAVLGDQQSIIVDGTCGTISRDAS